MALTALISDLPSLLSALGVTAVTAVAAAYGLFRYFGDKWLSAKFGERLESYKHAQQRELEQLKLTINTTFDRTVKLHGYEFDVLPELWTKLNTAFGSAIQFVSPLQSYPDLDRMNPKQFEEFLEKCGLDTWQKDELRATIKERWRVYSKMIFWKDINKVYDAYYHFNSYFIAKIIFIQPDLKASISELREIIDDALFERKVEEEHPNPRHGRFEKCDKLRKEGRSRLDAIGEAVRLRLWAATSMPTESVADS